MAKFLLLAVDTRTGILLLFGVCYYVYVLVCLLGYVTKLLVVRVK
jgi:hypothetical protein